MTYNIAGFRFCGQCHQGMDCGLKQRCAFNDACNTSADFFDKATALSHQPTAEEIAARKKREASAKFCKDCKHYVAPISCDGGTVLPGVFIHIPAACRSEQIGSTVDLVSGEVRPGRMDCSEVRGDETKCGAAGIWFSIATLDGRLAMLEHDS